MSKKDTDRKTMENLEKYLNQNPEIWNESPVRQSWRDKKTNWITRLLPYVGIAALLILGLLVMKPFQAVDQEYALEDLEKIDNFKSALELQEAYRLVQKKYTRVN